MKKHKTTGICHNYDDEDDSGGEDSGMDENIDHEYKGNSIKPPSISSVVRNAQEKDRRAARKAAGWQSFKLRKSPKRY